MCTLGHAMTGLVPSDAAALAAVVRGHGDPEAARWLTDALAQLSEPPDPRKTRVALARAARKLGAALPAVSEALRAELPAGPSYDAWALRDYGRAALLLTACARLSVDAQLDFVEPLVRRAELGEQVSLLRMAPLLPGPARFVPVIVDACRTNSLDVFEAIACGNPFVRDHFPEANYNQLVLKALFMEVAVDRIAGLPVRVNPPLLQMIDDYAAERRAAGRTVPPDIARIHDLAEAQTQ